VSTCSTTILESLSSVPAATTQVVIARVKSSARSAGTVTTYEDVDGCWTKVMGPKLAYFGRRGVSLHRHEGDETSPEGIFSLGTLVYGIDPRVTTTLRYHHLVCGDWWDEQPGTKYYNRFVHVRCGSPPPFGAGSEPLWTEAPWYDSFITIGFNRHPVIQGRGSAIFLHVTGGGPTEGCVTVSHGYLDAILKWLSPPDHPEIVISTSANMSRW
jgi:L,D-peptidoglycan transpeptidase YkuD (ErfK/YbiS/YcfS/YnhG family)